MEECEVKFLDIDVPDIERRLAAMGAVKQGEYAYRRRVFDYPDLRLDKRGAWIRLRDEGSKVTLAYKQRLGMKAADGSANDSGMREIEIVVDDFDKTHEFFKACGFIEKLHEENRRTRWTKGDMEFDIDFWPLLPPYLEIEAPTWEQVSEGIRELGLDESQKKIFTVHQIYTMHGIDEMEYEYLGFDRAIKKKS